MNPQNWRRALRASVAIAVLFGLLFSLLTPAHQSTTLSCILFLPVFFAGIVTIPATIDRLGEAEPQTSNLFLSNSSRFQRPPPVAIA